MASVSTLGILGQERPFDLVRLEPSEDLAPWIERHWIVRWDLERPHLQATLPHPCVNVVFEAGKTAVHGIGTRRFEIVLEGRGGVVGTKFRPGAFLPFFGRSVAELVDRQLPLEAVFGPIPPTLEQQVLERGPAPFEALLRGRLPAPDPNVELVNGMTRAALEDRSITRVEQLVEVTAVSARTMQRLFRRYVGVSPKWVIRRYRIQEAAERARSGGVDWAALATELGYYDQAHFSRDFRAQVGLAPSAYAAG